MEILIDLAERGIVPDVFMRQGIRWLIRSRAKEQSVDDLQLREMQLRDFVQLLSESPLAVEQSAANDQHYEVPADFFSRIMGRYMKYSCCFWPDGTKNLDEAERNSLMEVIERAEISNGMRILELGCGWGSFSLFTASMFPECTITAVSNSHSQKEWITTRAEEKGIKNLKVITTDISNFSLDEEFDRIVSIEMFEHLRNYRDLFSRISSWLAEEGKLFVHVFCTDHLPYCFEAKDSSDWMAKHFFTGGIMPSFDLFQYFQSDLILDTQWRVSGLHYAKTAESWLSNLDQNRLQVLSIFRKTLSGHEANTMFHRWRMFFMACAELFSFDNGRQWFVGHYLFRKNHERNA